MRIDRLASVASALLLASSLAGRAPADTRPNPYGPMPSEPDVTPAAPFRQGSWRAPVKTSGTSSWHRSFCNEPTSWSADDPVETVNALEATAQNYYAGSLEVPLDECGRASLEWISAEIEDRDLDIQTVGALNERSLGTGDGQVEPAIARSDYVEAIGQLRELPASRENLKAVLIDDFHNMLSSPELSITRPSLTVEDVESIHEAARGSSGLPPLAFTPYVAERAVATHIVPAHVLGVRGYGDGGEGTNEDYKLLQETEDYAKDIISVSHFFVPSAPSSLADSYQLSFLHFDYYDELDDGEIFFELVVAVNGRAVRRISLHHDPLDPAENYIRLFDGEVARGHDLLPGKNRISISVEANGDDVTKNKDKIALVWDVKLQRVRPGGLTGMVALAPPIYRAWRDPRRPGSSTAQMIAASNAEWRIDHAVDGVLVHYSEYASEFQEPVYRRFLESTARHLRSSGKTLQSVFWGNEQWVEDLDIDLDDRRDMYDLNRELTDGVVVYRLENALHLPSGGVFTEERTPLLDGFDYMAYFPAATSGTPGWHQSWTFPLTAPGAHTLRWTGDVSDPEKLRGRMCARVLGVDAAGAQRTLCERDLAGGPDRCPGDLSEDPGDCPDPFVIDDDSLTALVVEMEEKDSFGSAWFSLQFRLTDPEGYVLERDLYRAGVDAATQAIYETTVDFFCDSHLGCSECP